MQHLVHRLCLQGARSQEAVSQWEEEVKESKYYKVPSGRIMDLHFVEL